MPPKTEASGVSSAPTVAATAPTPAPAGADAGPVARDPLCVKARAAAAAAGDRHANANDCSRAAQATADRELCQAPEDKATADLESQTVYNECMETVLTQDVVRLVQGLPAKDGQRQARASDAFNKAAPQFCRRCDPQWGAECLGAVRTWADGVAWTAARQSLALDEPAEASDAPPAKPTKRAGGRDAFADAFQELARAVCALPPQMWRDHHAPPGCDARALASLRATLSPFPAKPAKSASCNLEGPSDP